MRRILLVVSCILLALLIVPCSASAKRAKYTFKIGSLAPEGSIWAKRFQAFVAEVDEKSNGEIGFKVYLGGVMGDDRAMYRKMRIGQLQGGGFTMTGISEMVPDFRVMGIPFLFTSYDEVDRVTKGLFPLFQESFAEKDMVLLAMSEVGFIYAMSAEPVVTIDDLQKRKCWVPESDPLSRNFLKNIGVTPVPLSIPDVLPSLQAGLINTVFNGFYGSIVLQWFTRTKYITNTPFGYAYGGFILSQKKFDKLPATYKKMMHQVAQKHFAGLLADTRKSNQEAMDTLIKNGNVIVAADPTAHKELIAMRDKTVSSMLGKAFSEKIYKATMRYLTAPGKDERSSSR